MTNHPKYELGARYIEQKPNVFIEAGTGDVPAAILAKSIWSNLTCIGFEPNPTTYRDVQGTFPGTIHNKAVRSVKGDCVFHVSGNCSSCYEHGNTTRITIIGTTLDDEEIPEGRVALWLDAEGSEKDILLGATKLLERTVLIRCEMWAKPPFGPLQDDCDITLFHKPATAADVDELLTGAGFTLKEKLHVRDCGNLWDAIYVKEGE